MSENTTTQGTATPKTSTMVIKTIEEKDIATQKDLRTTTKQVETFKKVKFADIRIRNVTTKKRFNKRLEENMGDIAGLADSIASIGLLKPLDVDALSSGEFILTDGERRFRAIQLLIERGNTDFEYVKVQLNPRDVTELERLVIMLASNGGKPFEPVEEAEAFKELRDTHKLEPVNIARSLGHSIAYVEQRLLLADTSAEEKEEIKKGNVSATVVMEQARKEKDPAKRVANIKEAVEKGTRLKVKDLKAPDEKIVNALSLVEEAQALLKEAKKDNEDEIVADGLHLLENKLIELKKLLK